mgnify:CR=1 FL=1
MNPCLQQVAKRGMDQAVTSQPSLAGEDGRDDQQTIVPAAAFGTGMARVPSRVVDHLQADRRQRCESLLNDRDNAGRSTSGGHVGHAGKAFLNGLTVTVA